MFKAKEITKETRYYEFEMLGEKITIMSVLENEMGIVYDFYMKIGNQPYNFIWGSCCDKASEKNYNEALEITFDNLLQGNCDLLRAIEERYEEYIINWDIEKLPKKANK